MDLFLTMAQLPSSPAVINVQHDFFIVSVRTVHSLCKYRVADSDLQLGFGTAADS